LENKMNAPEKFLTAHLGEAEVRVPERLAIAAYLKQQIDLTRPLSVGLAASIERIGESREPNFGEAWQGGLYAGLTLHDNDPYRLVLLPGDMDDAPWEEAKTWAKAQGGELPSRVDGLVLFKNLRSEFKREAYWTGEPTADVAGYAWRQHFYDGYQDGWRQSHELRARAVRRVSL
jgi:hypothetical protein